MKNLSLLMIMLLVLTACGSDDDRGQIQLRDEGEVKEENEVSIEDFLSTHYYQMETNQSNPNFERIVFDSISDGEEAIIDSEFLDSKTVTKNDIEYEIYYLKIREGASSERHPTFADSTLVTYEGFTLKNKVFDVSPNPIWFDLTQIIPGFYETLPEFRGGTGFVENPDGTVTFNDDFGIGAAFIPSGLGYFANPPTSSQIAPYDPIIFTFQLYKSRETDHDGDGIPTWQEDVNGNHDVNDDDTDKDGVPNFLDADDDGDGVPTREEIIINDDGTIEFPDSNGNGTPDYLDSDYPLE
ncbi:MAG: hypothetical protein L0J45_04335 [Psychroflexus sp.]|nr:hypothetical protein [Psychroflexus sp.]MDN6310406.1 hypothetical protein [Psychroflexus sp.]